MRSNCIQQGIYFGEFAHLISKKPNFCIPRNSRRRHDNANFAQRLFMPLQFLEFDAGEDTDGFRNWDAVASPAPRHNQALLDELGAVLRHLAGTLGAAGPLDNGHAWDLDLHIQDEQHRPLMPEAARACALRLTLSLSLSGTAALADLMEELALD